MRCKNCKEVFTPVKFNQKYCLESDCVRVWVEVEKEKQWKKKKKQLKDELQTLPELLKLAQITFNKYIRLRDKDKPCISCEKPLGAKYDASHYYSAGGHFNVRFNEDNVHASCVYCNQYLHGNLLNYQIGLVKRIGERMFELNEKAHITKKWTKNELLELISLYKNKIKEFN